VARHGDGVGTTAVGVGTPQPGAPPHVRCGDFGLNGAALSAGTGIAGKERADDCYTGRRRVSREARPMLEALFNKPLELQVGDRTLRFDSKMDFEFALASRTDVPAAKIAELVRFDTQQLLEEANNVRQVERHFVEMLSRSIQEPGSIGYLLREMDTKLFSHDHEWRAIMASLARQDRRFDDYKQLALIKYVQYLASRQDVLKGIYAHKSSLSGRVSEPVADLDPSCRQTVIFDVEDLAPCPTTPPRDDDTRVLGAGVGQAFPQLCRLPRGESVAVDPPRGEDLALVLSRHPFRVRRRGQPVLVDDKDDARPLAIGRNVIGRHPDSDVMVDAAYRDISRTHLILELGAQGQLRLTDLSAHGTFVPSNLVDASEG
jgi:hypothetical protein